MTLRKYTSHKTVEAARILRVGRDAHHGENFLDLDPGMTGEIANISVTVPDSYIEKHNPQAGGYFVRYPDGYESFSPAKSFEQGYKPTEEVVAANDWLNQQIELLIVRRALEYGSSVEAIKTKLWGSRDT